MGGSIKMAGRRFRATVGERASIVFGCFTGLARISVVKGPSLAVAGMAIVALACPVVAQAPKSRITSAIRDEVRTTLTGTASPHARFEQDAGALPDGEKLSGMTLVFSLSDAQKADQDVLLAAQQNPASPLYHQWLTPDQYGARFGMSDADLTQVENWLQSEGFTVDGVSHSRTRITFSGTAGQVASTFHTSLHHFKGVTETHFAPASDLSLPAALASTVSSIENLSSFRPKPHVRIAPTAKVEANLTSGQGGVHYMSPGDVATIYDINPAYNSGFTGTGQTIAVVGQSAINTSDITTFQTVVGLPAKAPNLVLVPNSGASTIVLGDESESDLDVEYSGAMAKGATISFVYTGSGQNKGVFDAIVAAVDQKIGTVISDSYGECEPVLGSTSYAYYNAALAQAAAQGQTVVAAAGDDGSQDCLFATNQVSVAEELAADFPASSQYVAAMGGTEFPAAAVLTSGTNYWASASGSDVVSSALSYIPEQVWNDDQVAGQPDAGGGGTSVYTARPIWQTGVIGIPAGSARVIPDISLDASNVYAPYVFCSSDTSAWQQTASGQLLQSGSCTHGLLDNNSVYYTGAGGTSFSAPIFAGMMAIANQAKNPAGQGLVNPTLYTLASNPTTYATAFHDIVSGGNNCPTGTSYCTTAAAASYLSTAGYDEASGLGSVDFTNLLAAWPSAAGGTSLIGSTTKLVAANTSPTLNMADTITISVAPYSNASAILPTGTVAVSVDGKVVNPSVPLLNGNATYSFSAATAGSHVIAATYSGDAVYEGSSGTVTVTIALASNASFTVQANNVTVAAGSSGVSTVTVTPNNGYTGTVTWSLAAKTSISNSCFTIANVTVPGTGSVSTALTIYTSASACSATGASRSARIGVVRAMARGGNPPPPPFGSGADRTGYTLAGLAGSAGLLLVGFFGLRSRRLRPLLPLAVLALAGIGLSGCGDNSSAVTPTGPTTGTNTAPGTYSLTLTGTDANNAAITSSATLTLTVQ